MSETSRIIRPLLEFLFPSAAPETLSIYHGYIRKLAHFIEYALLAVLALRALGMYRFRYLAAFGFAFLVAVADESNQSLNPARTSSPRDVVLDLAGAVVALLSFKLLFDRRRGDE